MSLRPLPALVKNRRSYTRFSFGGTLWPLIAAHYRAGSSLRDLERETGMSRPWVLKVLRDQNVEMRPRGTHGHKKKG